MSVAATLARVGDVVDGLVASARATPGLVRMAWAERLPRRVGVVAGTVVLLGYLF